VGIDEAHETAHWGIYRPLGRLIAFHKLYQYLSFDIGECLVAERVHARPKQWLDVRSPRPSLEFVTNLESALAAIVMSLPARMAASMEDDGMHELTGVDREMQSERRQIDAELEAELARVERQIYSLEGLYLRSSAGATAATSLKKFPDVVKQSAPLGSVPRGLYSMHAKDRVFSSSSATSHATGRSRSEDKTSSDGRHKQAKSESEKGKDVKKSAKKGARGSASKARSSKRASRTSTTTRSTPSGKKRSGSKSAKGKKS